MMGDTERSRFAAGLPAELTRFIGRDIEVTEVKDMLSGPERLVSLIGVGGVGKTRVGLRVCREVRADFPDGVHFVELSALRDPHLLPNAVSAIVGLPEQSDASDGSQLEVLISYFGDKRLLVVLDTCEHLIDACAEIAQAVLLRCPEVRILATSRQPLDVPGEQLLQIMPLYAPDPADADAHVDGAIPDAMVLFSERAAAVVHGFEITDANRTVVAGLCHRLDGIPLAIELAVVRLRALPLERLLELLDDRFRLLTGGSRAMLPRHQTLRTAIDWSYELCSEAEQLLWARLSVFPGTFGLSAAEQICSGDLLPADEVLERLIGLVDKAIVLRADVPVRPSGPNTAHSNGHAGTGVDEGDLPYRMLDTIREYGSRLLTDLSGERELRARHRDHFLAMAREFAPSWLSDLQTPWLRRLRRELPNLRAALEFCCTSRAEAESGLELATALWGFWHCSGRLVEGCHWLERLLALCPEPSRARMHALNAAADLGLVAGGHERGIELLAEATTLAEEYDDPIALAYVAKNRLVVSAVTGEHSRLSEQLADARRRFAELGDRGGEAWALAHMGGGMAMAGDYQEGARLCELTCTVLACPEERWLQTWMTCMKGIALHGLDRFEEAGDALRSALAMGIETDHTQALAFSFDTLGWVAAAEGRYDEAARLLGTAVKMWEKFHEPRVGNPSMHRAHEDAVALTRGALGPMRFRELFDQGAALPLRQAVSLAVDRHAISTEQETEGTAGPWAILTAREREIAVLVAEGLSNRQIAVRLVISKRTVDSHLEHISRKLGYSSRVQIAALADENATMHGMDPTA